METIEQLKQENEKLNARLAKAVEVFKEQKASIEALTEKVDTLEHDAECFNGILEAKEKEISELKSLNDESINAGVKLGEEIAQLKAQLHNKENIVDQDATIKELQNTIESKDQAYRVLQETYNNLFVENTKQKTELNQAITLYEDAKLEIDEVKQANSKCIKENEDLKIKLEQRLQQVRATENTANEEVKKVTAARDELIIKYSNLETQLNATRDEITSLHDQLIKGEQDLQNTKKTCEEYKESYEQQKKENKDTEEQFNKVLSSYESDIEKLKETISAKDKEYKLLQETYNNIFDQNTTLNENIVKLTNDIANYENYKNFTNNVLKLLEAMSLTHEYAEDNIIKKESNTNSKLTKPVSSTIKVTTNSTGNQFMNDAKGMNI